MRYSISFVSDEVCASSGSSQTEMPEKAWENFFTLVSATRDGGDVAAVAVIPCRRWPMYCRLTSRSWTLVAYELRMVYLWTMDGGGRWWPVRTIVILEYEVRRWWSCKVVHIDKSGLEWRENQIISNYHYFYLKIISLLRENKFGIKYWISKFQYLYFFLPNVPYVLDTTSTSSTRPDGRTGRARHLPPPKRSCPPRTRPHPQLYDHGHGHGDADGPTAYGCPMPRRIERHQLSYLLWG